MFICSCGYFKVLAHISYIMKEIKECCITFVIHHFLTNYNKRYKLLVTKCCKTNYNIIWPINNFYCIVITASFLERQTPTDGYWILYNVIQEIEPVRERLQYSWTCCGKCHIFIKFYRTTELRYTTVVRVPLSIQTWTTILKILLDGKGSKSGHSFSKIKLL